MSAAEDFAEIVRAHVGGMAVPAGDPWPGLDEAPAPAPDASEATPAEEFATFMDEQLGTVPAAEQMPAEPMPRTPAPNPAQGTSDGATPRLSPSEMFVDFLSTQIRGVNRDAFRGSADAAAAGQQVGWKSA